MIEWFQLDETSSIDHDANVIWASNNKLEHEYNGNDGISQRFEAFDALEIGLRWYEAMEGT